MSLTDNPLTTRRAALRKGAVATAAAGVAWSAPRVDGLSLRPEYATAQTGPGDADAGASFDVTLSVSSIPSSSITSSFVSIDNPAPGLDLTRVSYLRLSDPGGFHGFVGQIFGSAASVNCNIAGMDGFVNVAPVVPPFSVPPTINPIGGGQQATRSGSGPPSASGSALAVLHVTCT